MLAFGRVSGRCHGDSTDNVVPLASIVKLVLGPEFRLLNKHSFSQPFGLSTVTLIFCTLNNLFGLARHEEFKAAAEGLRSQNSLRFRCEWPGFSD